MSLGASEPQSHDGEEIFMPTQYPRYEEDYYGWIQATALLLKQRKFNEVDMDHVIEEMEDMGRSERHQLMNRLTVLLAHLLKWAYQPDFRGRSWLGTLKEQRKRLRMLLKDNPSLKSRVNDSFPDAYELALDMIEKETPIDLKLLPQTCPYTFEQCLDDTFFPSA